MRRRVGLKIGVMAAVTMMTLSGCFDIQEHIVLNSDGSGTFEFVVDMSEAKRITDMLSGMVPQEPTGDGQSDANAGEDALSSDDLVSDFEQMRGTFEALEGISAIEVQQDPEALVAGIAFSFDSIEGLNRAMGMIYDEEGEVGDEVYVTFDGSEYRRLDPIGFTGGLMEETGSEEDLAMLVQAGILTRMAFTSSVSFPRPVGRIDPSVAKVDSDDPQTVRLVYDFLSSDRPQEGIQMTVQLR